MNRKDIVRQCLLDACHGELQTLTGLLDYLILDCKISPDRLVAIADRQFGMSPEVTLNIFYKLQPRVIH
jgi:hypothetical protein